MNTDWQICGCRSSDFGAIHTIVARLDSVAEYLRRRFRLHTVVIESLEKIEETPQSPK